MDPTIVHRNMLIARSILHDEITRTYWTPELADALEAACDNSTDAGPELYEYWGTDDQGQDWRVHLSGARE